MPELSVLLPVKNGLPYIKRAVSSTVRAMPRDAELVILNDGSTDGTGAYLETLSDRRIRVIHSEQSSGIARGLNRLLEESDSKYIARMDADDVSLPGRFHHQYQALQNDDLLFSSSIFMTRRGVPLRPQLPYTIKSESFALHLLMGNFVCHSAMFGLRSAIDRVGPYSFSAAEDYELWLRCAGAGVKMTRTSVPTLLQRQHKSLTTTADWIRWFLEDQTLSGSYFSAAQASLGRASIPSDWMAFALGQNGGFLPQDLKSAILGAARGLSPRQQRYLNARIRRIATK